MSVDVNQMQNLEAEVMTCNEVERKQVQYITELTNVRERLARSAAHKVLPFPLITSCNMWLPRPQYLRRLDKMKYTNNFFIKPPPQEWLNMTVPNCLITGHTHKDIDQRLSVISGTLKRFHRDFHLKRLGENYKSILSPSLEQCDHRVFVLMMHNLNYDVNDGNTEWKVCSAPEHDQFYKMAVCAVDGDERQDRVAEQLHHQLWEKSGGARAPVPRVHHSLQPGPQSTQQICFPHHGGSHAFHGLSVAWSLSLWNKVRFKFGNWVCNSASKSTRLSLWAYIRDKELKEKSFYVLRADSRT